MSRVVIVTGAFGALGPATVEALRESGWRVAAIDSAPVSDVQADLVLADVDLSDVHAVDAAFAQVSSHLGDPAGLANIAGGFVWEPMEAGRPGHWEAMFRANLLTAALGARAALPALLRTRGAIVNVGAASASEPGAGLAAYAASKAGVMALTSSMAAELKGRGVRVNAILPTILDTPTNRRDMPGSDPAEWVKPSDAAGVIAFLLSDAANCINGAGLKLSV